MTRYRKTKTIKINISQLTMMKSTETSNERVGGACSSSANEAHVTVIDCFLPSLTTEQMLQVGDTLEMSITKKFAKN